jgi:hypothetical protein
LRTIFHELGRAWDIGTFSDAHAGVADQQKYICTQIAAAEELLLQELILLLLAPQHVLEIFRRSLPIGDKRSRLDRLANRLTKIFAEIRNLQSL